MASSVEESRSLAEKKTTEPNVSVNCPKPSAVPPSEQDIGQEIGQDTRPEPPSREQKRRKSRHTCNLSLCPCDEDTCRMSYAHTRRKERFSLFREYLDRVDPYRKGKEKEKKKKGKESQSITLCCCHFDSSMNLVVPPMVERMARMIREKEEEMERVREGLRRAFTEDEMRILMERRSRVHFSHQSLVKSLRMYEKIGKTSYKYLISTGLPFPSHRTLQRFKSGIVNGIHDTVLGEVMGREGEGEGGEDGEGESCSDLFTHHPMEAATALISIVNDPNN